MKAAEIANLYRKAAPVFGHRPSAWLLLLLVCEAGSAGMTVNAFCQVINHASRNSRQTTLRRWHQAGLLEVREIPANGRRGGRKQKVYVATSKAFQLLRIEEGI